MTAQAKTYTTIEEFNRLLADPANQDRLLELVHGEIIEKAPTPLHAVLAGWIATLLNMYLIENPIGIVGVEARHDQGDDNARLPDVSFVKGHLDSLPPNSFSTMPDLAVEIKSPHDTYKRLRNKAEYYLQNGSQMVWLVFPEKDIIEVYMAGEDSEIMTINDMLDGRNVLPGLKLPVRQVLRK